MLSSTFFLLPEKTQCLWTEHLTRVWCPVIVLVTMQNYNVLESRTRRVAYLVRNGQLDYEYSYIYDTTFFCDHCCWVFPLYSVIITCIYSYNGSNRHVLFFFFFKYMHTLYVIFCVPLANVRQHSLLLGIFFFTSCPVIFSHFLCAPCYFQLLDYFPLGCQDIPVNIGITQQKAILFIHNYGFFLFYFF